ncbi:aminotransferase class I/II-fold pyridoxal phosphate-dependent enzyme [Kitasatospora cineracea]|uniref:aminotransferase class I/II-fold pyridoxal phosphate-dependent enzyme n=1 Tax=Kitasatospora cineracea TaxID=88074 RepID=UPI0033C4587D
MSREELLRLAAGSGLPVLDLSLGVPADPSPADPLPADPAPPAPSARPAPAAYPASAGSEVLRTAAAGYLHRRFGVRVPVEAVAACVGTKEFISTLPLFLREIRGDDARDTVLIPALCYPTYEYGARLAGLRVHRVPVDGRLRMRLDLLPAAVVGRALCLWVNSPANPTGTVEPLDRIAAWGRARGVPVLSDEAYAEATWAHPPRTVLAGGLSGVLAVHSLSKRSHAPGLRVGFYAGDPHLVAELVPRRRAAGLMAGSASQARAAALLDDDAHALAQRERNARRVAGLVAELDRAGLPCRPPGGGLFAWVAAPDGRGTAFARRLAAEAGLVVMPGAEYGPGGGGHVRIAAVHDPAAVAARLALLRHPALVPTP